jgi:hypothetical protein
MAEFLEEIPPGQERHISDLCDYVSPSGSTNFINRLNTPELQLHCEGEECNGLRFFRPSVKDVWLERGKKASNRFVSYLCSNCRQSTKMFSIAVAPKEDGESAGYGVKYGERPAFGPPTPARLITLVGPDRDKFLKGRRSEIQGLGVGAFTYYRRVVENQKNRVLREIIKVATKIGADAADIEQLEGAINETQFSKAMEVAKDALPQSLLINGENPLSLLHSALSDGLHNQTDEHCLQIASAVRVVLGELSERLGQALKDEAELKRAVTTLGKSRSLPRIKPA